MSNWAVVGAEVVERTGTWGLVYSYGQIKRIAKVYKNGNFVVDGETQQWRVRGDSASRTGEHGFYSSTSKLVPVSDAIRADMERASCYLASRTALEKEAKRLEHIARTDVDEAIAEAAKLAERSK